MNVDNFDDGTSVEWFSRETLFYRNHNYMVQVEYDYLKIGTSKMGRTIFLDSINKWEEHPAGTSSTISKEVKQEIISKVIEYFRKRNFLVKVDER